MDRKFQKKKKRLIQIRYFKMWSYSRKKLFQIMSRNLFVFFLLINFYCSSIDTTGKVGYIKIYLELKLMHIDISQI